MRSLEPPRIPTWLLRHFGSSPNNQSVIGDLAERYRHGQTAKWYWTQALLAIVVSGFNEIRGHKLTAIRALIVGWITLLVLANDVVFPVYGRLVGELDQLRIPLVYVFGAAVGIIGLGSGWTVARFHRSHQRAAVLVYVASVLLFLFVFSMTVGIGESPLSVGGSRVFYCLNSAFLMLGILTGGQLLAPPVIARK
jgi:hypothetical protein